jgi:hypothetical protein
VGLAPGHRRVRVGSEWRTVRFDLEFGDDKDGLTSAAEIEADGPLQCSRTIDPELMDRHVLHRL